MQSLFELKNKITFDSNIFNNMKETAIKLLHNAKSDKYTQALVLFSSTGNRYSTIIRNACSEEKTEEASLIESLKIAEDTELSYVLCMWQDNGIDIPSFTFRKMLCTLNPKNSESLLFVMTAGGVSAIKAYSTMI